MVPEFDKAVFSSDVGSVVGPIKTQFGYHLLEVTKRV
jgi:peptidyl-prolyl cis-trans isomerase C